MAAANSEGNGQKPRLETFQLFSSSASAFGIFDDAAQQVPHIPPPPCVEVLASEVPSSIKHNVDSVNLDGVTLLKVGSGHGLPGIFALLEGAAAVHFQDFNAEVLRFLTIPNLNANLSRDTQLSSFNSTICDKAEVCFFAGDWSGIDKLLPHVSTDAKNNQGDGYDFILMAETVYSINSLQNLYDLIKKCLQHPDGVVYMAAKKYYFGVGGGTGDFCLW
ncbi:Histidine protein methyltransferase 1-like isoform C [Glycine soja]|uniref:protein-histidine N-methyltransferase n=1 Tax=Glycine soja TaxID=3848 RepID=A0A445HIG5_GLYSO|nr:Histidine protein methyltransferase 1-like isoform C [Glycine soja]